MIHEFMPYIFVLNFTNMIPRKNLCLYKATKSVGWSLSALEGAIVNKATMVCASREAARSANHQRSIADRL